MKKIALMCDSSADITKEEAAELGIHVLRMPITINGKEFIEEETISDQEIIEALGQNKSVKTAQPIIGNMTRMWDELLKTHDEIFYIPLTKAAIRNLWCCHGDCRSGAISQPRLCFKFRFRMLSGYSYAAYGKGYV